MNQETNFANSWSPNQSWNLNTGLSFDLQSSSADSTKGTLHLTISNLSPPYDQLCKVHSVGQKSNKKCSSCNLLFFFTCMAIVLHAEIGVEIFWRIINSVIANTNQTKEKKTVCVCVAIDKKNRQLYGYLLSKAENKFLTLIGLSPWNFE